MTITLLMGADDSPSKSLSNAIDDMAIVDEDNSVVVDVLGNDLDPDNDPLTVDSATDSSNGLTAVNADGTVTYTPDADFNGTDEFTYTISDGNGGTSTATVTVTVNGVNDAPNAVDDTASTSKDAAIAVNVVSNDSDIDGDSLTVESIDTTNTTGLVTLVDGTPTYDPNGQFDALNEGDSATDSFTYTINDGSGGMDTATVDVTITATPPAVDSFFLSLDKNGTVDGLNVANEDILQFDGNNFSVFFDGSDVGIADNIDGLAVISATEILMSFQTAVTLADVGTVEDGDIVKFTASALGSDTAGTFAMYLDGSQVGLTAGIDGLTGLSDGSLLISTDKKTNVPVLGQVRDEDILRFTPTTPGDNTSGSWSMYVDGGEVGLGTFAENIDALGVDAAGDLLLSTQGNFDVTTIAGADEDVFIYTPASSTSGTYSPDLFFDGSLFGLGGNDISGLSASIDVQ